MIQILHNPRCGKSRNCLAFVEESKQEYQVIPYLVETPTFEELKKLIEKLKIQPIELVRVKEKVWIENFKGKTMSDDQILQAMIENPILIERPIVIKGDKAIIGRDLGLLESFLK